MLKMSEMYVTPLEAITKKNIYVKESKLWADDDGNCVQNTNIN